MEFCWSTIAPERGRKCRLFARFRLLFSVITSMHRLFLRSFAFFAPALGSLHSSPRSVPAPSARSLRLNFCFSSPFLYLGGRERRAGVFGYKKRETLVQNVSLFILSVLSPSPDGQNRCQNGQNGVKWHTHCHIFPSLSILNASLSTEGYSLVPSSQRKNKGHSSGQQVSYSSEI